MRKKTGHQFQVHFPGRHAVYIQVFRSDYFEESHIGIGLGGIVDPESGITQKIPHLPAAEPQYLFIINIERTSVLLQ